MQQWEYCEMRWAVAAKYESVRPSVVFYRDPNRPWTPPEGITAEHMAFKLGLDGWELVSVIVHQGLGATSGPQIHWYFKRSITAVDK